FGQKSSKPKLSYKLLSVRVKGATHLKDEQVIAASGLKLGQLAAESDFQRAMQALGDSGLFTNLTATYHYSSAGCEVESQLAETPSLVPPLYDNLVWFSVVEL